MAVRKRNNCCVFKRRKVSDEIQVGNGTFIYVLNILIAG